MTIITRSLEILNPPPYAAMLAAFSAGASSVARGLNSRLSAISGHTAYAMAISEQHNNAA
jgi:hypothetical protein